MTKKKIICCAAGCRWERILLLFLFLLLCSMPSTLSVLTQSVLLLLLLRSQFCDLCLVLWVWVRVLGFFLLFLSLSVWMLCTWHKCVYVSVWYEHFSLVLAILTIRQINTTESSEKKIWGYVLYGGSPNSEFLSGE